MLLTMVADYKIKIFMNAVFDTPIFERSVANTDLNTFNIIRIRGRLVVRASTF